MDPVQKVLFNNDSASDLELTFKSPYLYWIKSDKVKCYHEDTILGISLEVNSIKVMTLNKSRLKTHSFAVTSDPDLFINSVKIAIYPKPRKFLMIINKLSGSSKSMEIFEQVLVPILRETPYSFGYCEVFNDYMTKLEDSVTDLVFLSGDGTIHRVLSKIHAKNSKILQTLNIGVLPTGSRNSLAVELNGKDLMRAVYCIARGKTFKGDLIKVKIDDEELLATCAVLWGIGADIPKEADELRSLGPARFPLVILRKLVKKWKQHKACIIYEDENGEKHEKQAKFTGVFFGNHRSRNLINDEIPFPHANIQSGCIDGILVQDCGKFRSLQLFWQTMNSGAHVNNPKAEFIKFKNAELKCEKPSNVSIDGEIYSASSIQLIVWPGCINFLGSPQP